MFDPMHQAPLRRRPRGRPDTREAILICAEQLLQARGFNGFSYQHIAAQLQIRPAAIHYHFPSKDDLGAALVQRYREKFREWAREHDERLDPRARLLAYFATYQRHLDERVAQLCPGGVLSTEYLTLTDAIREEARALICDLHQWLRQLLEEGRQAQRLCFVGDASDKAVEIAAALQGGLQIARVYGVSRFRQLLTQLSLELTGESNDEGALP
ncbi:transcriptional regulator, TetR family [Solimonas aquatica]|uniref:Transcriptional regulator, TetR family n=1 Tax=Solimonas aquatica TaxID=489703 RepID=A0A1H9AHZ8_9GAMM|nr:TetR/AcrR family transcriptional regulator [Solimonas aquatica]SEP76330.1 transcriptional regulator, TetR family [Solimonas aquatica]